MNSRRAVFSVDLETLQYTPAYRNAGLTIEDPIGLGAVKNLLNVLDEYEISATFFIVGELAAEYPKLVSGIAEAGHEIASHTQSHRLLDELSREQRCSELKVSKATLKQITSEEVDGFRAPAFALSEDHWQLLDATEYKYDSSVVPARRIPGWYGGDFTQRDPTPATAFDDTIGSELTTVPVGVAPGVKLPISGAWLRLFGIHYTLIGMRLLARQGHVPVLYIHPWELVDLSEYRSLPRRVSWRTGAWMQRAVERLLQQPFAFITSGTLAAEQSGTN